ncbi:MAG: hypothetical protein LBS71_02470, partial [Puniceicoccales bacterium]|nr:hypothetical protein [Puniceicoccales bacterium]
VVQPTIPAPQAAPQQQQTALKWPEIVLQSEDEDESLTLTEDSQFITQPVPVPSDIDAEEDSQSSSEEDNQGYLRFKHFQCHPHLQNDHVTLRR